MQEEKKGKVTKMGKKTVVYAEMEDHGERSAITLRFDGNGKDILTLIAHAAGQIIREGFEEPEEMIRASAEFGAMVLKAAMKEQEECTKIDFSALRGMKESEESEGGAENE